MSRIITRRDALKLIAAGIAAALSPAFHARARHPASPESKPGANDDIWIWVGRAIQTVTFYDRPSTQSMRLVTHFRDRFFPITREVRAPFSDHNDLWYETPLGYVHSAWVLPVRVYVPQPFIRDIGAWGFWGEVSHVFTDARAEPDIESRPAYRFYGGTVYHVVDVFEDEYGTGWYKVFDEFPPTNPGHQWVLARDLRRISRAEMSPIHPFAGEKRIEVDLDKQRLVCYEGERLVFTTRVASGVDRAKVSTPTNRATPIGKKFVLLKQPSRHMSNRPYPGGPPLAGDIFDLPGIPWNVFFDPGGAAIHGTYWHNDFGIRRSHGCVNVPVAAARWLYRWVYPIGGYEDEYIQSDSQVGTPIHVF